MRLPANTPPIRCAIYTRKSTDEVLESDFNSLDAQREAAEAYTVRRTRPLSTTRSKTRCISSVSRTDSATNNAAGISFMNAFSRAYRASFAKYWLSATVYRARHFHSDSLLSLEKSKMLRPIHLAAFALALLLASLSSVGTDLEAQDKSKSPLDRMIPQSDLRSGRLYNERGSSIGRVESRNGSTRAFDAAGKSTGRSDSRNGSTRFYDSSGASQGRAESSGTSTRFFDKSGRSVGSSRTSGSTTRYYGPSGAYQGRSQTTNGTTRYYDSTGKSLGTKRP